MTETTQPDPQVVAWMRGHASTLDGVTEQTRKLRTIKAYRDAHPEPFMRLEPLVDAYREAARKPLTVADIPAGQGAASLFLRRLERSGKLVAWYRANDIETIAFMREPEPHAGPAEHALWEHLATTLPTVATEETP